MTERADCLKTLIRHSTESELKMYIGWFNDTPCSEKMSEQKKEIKEAIEYLKKDGSVNITIKEDEEFYTITLKAIQSNIHQDCENYSPKKDYCLKYFEPNVSENYPECKEKTVFNDKNLSRKWSN